MDAPSRKGLDAAEYCGQDYEEDDILSFANNLLSDNDHENEYQQLLDTHYKELSLFSPSPTFHTKEKDEEDNYDSQEDDDEEQSESIFKALDEFYVKSDSHQRRRSSQKLRRKYPDIHIDDMGFRTGLEPDLSLGSPTLSSSRDESLPLGWEKHEDEAGPYYWHIKSGTIQRQPPEIVDFDSESNRVSETERPSNNDHESIFEYGTEWPKKFTVRSLGWKEIEKHSLTPEKSSRAVNRCILDLSMGKNETLDAIGRWGEGKDIYLEMYPDKLCLVDAGDGNGSLNQTMMSVPIETIRVWGVGRDDSRDFAFVTHESSSDTFKCHVLRCDLPARKIAQALKELCQDYIAKHAHKSGRIKHGTASKRPRTLPLGFQRQSSLLASGSVFPTPTEEPKKVFKVLYMGRRPVKVGVGIDVLHHIIEQILSECPEDEWIAISVAVSPSTITLTTQDEEPEIIAECRVRYLTFLGIGQNDVRTCGFVVHTPEDTFLAHCFACEPSGGSLCKAIEAACKLRYQKFLDAHSKAVEEANSKDLMTPTEVTELSSQVLVE